MLARNDRKSNYAKFSRYGLTLGIILALMLACFQESTAGTLITLEGCRERALVNSEDLRVEKTRREQAHLRTREQRTHYLPKVTASGHYLGSRNRFEWDVESSLFDPLGRIISPATINPLTGRPINDVSGHHIMKQTAYYTKVEARQPLYMGGKINAANRMSEVAEHISLKAVEAKRQDVIVEADQTYWRFVAVGEKLQSARKYVELLEALEAKVNHAVDTGLVHRNELLKVRVRRNEALLDLERAKNGRELLRMSLCRIMGFDPGTSLKIADEEITIPAADELPEAPVLSVIDRPDYRMLEDKVDLTRENERLVRSDFLPRVGLTAGYHYLGGVELYQTSLEGRGYYLMASAEIPLWQWGEGKYKTQSAKLDSHIAELDLQKYKKLMELEIRQAFFAMSEAHSRCAMTEAALEEAEANMEMSRDFYELGMEQLTDHLEAQSRRQQAEAEHITAKSEFKIEETNYRRSLGKCP
ncbi:MAG: hypothetical protein AVO39_05905 [delta proteobacterium MLS_D]|nr:MAG: hypothetical protein AVO39_05905 [delta proteobacterium MLS_D]